MRTQEGGPFIVILGALAAMGCGGSSGGGGGTLAGAATTTPTAAATAAPTAAPTAPPPRPGAPPPPAAPPQGAPPPAGSPDAQLQAQLGAAGVSAAPAPAPQPAALVALGRNLFFDKVLSGNRNIACASCHQPAVATGDGLSLALGEGAVGMAPNRVATASVQVIARNAPPLFALGHQGVLFRDGRVQRDPATGALTTPEPVLNGPTPTRPDLTAPLTTALAAQALFPVATHAEMRGETGTNELANAPDNVTVWALIMARLVGTQNGTQGGIAEYRTEFQAAFPAVTSFDLLTFSHAAQAIAAFEIATFTLLDTPFDQYLAGNLQALSAQQKSGALVFSGRGRCVQCHKGPLLSDESFHALAIPQLGPGAGGEPDDRGRALISGDTRDNYRFRTPPLRNVGTTGPYMHDGAFVTLDRILQHYRNPAQSLQSYTGSELTPALQATVDHDPTRDQARLAAVDPIIGPGIPLSPQDTQDLIAFLGALTDPAATSAASVPATVPSGLPVAD